MTWDFEMVLVSHLRLPGRRPHIAELKKLPFILFRRGSRMQEPIDRYFSTYGFRPNVTMRLDSSDLIKRMISAGLGVGMLPYSVVAADIRNGSLAMIRQAEPPLYSKHALVRRKLSYVPQPVKAFMEAARELDRSRLRLLTVKRSLTEEKNSVSQAGANVTQVTARSL